MRVVYPKVSIIILNWNGVKDTVECLESLKKITYPNCEVIVVDNGSEGNDVEVLQEKYGDHIHIIENDKNYGFIEGNNLTIGWLLENSEPDYFLLLNNDTVVDKEFLTEMVKVAESDSQVGIAGSKTYFYDDHNRLQLAWIRIDMRKGQAFHVGGKDFDKGQYESITEVDCVQGSCFLIKRRVIERVGLLDKDYFAYWDEEDYCLRARRAGYKVVYVPKARIWHKVLSSSKRISGFFQYYVTRNRFLFMKKHATTMQTFSSLLYFFGFRFWFSTGILVIYQRDVRGFVSFLRGTKDGLKLLLS